MATPTPAVRFSDVPENLPRRFALSTNTGRPIKTSGGDLVVAPLKEEDDGSIFTSPQARLFYFEPSKKHGRRLLHIRSCYNNKYFVANQPAEAASDDAIVITGAATDREEDLGKPLCTLFAVVLSADGQDFVKNNRYDASFYDPQLGKRAFILEHADGQEDTLHKDFFLRDMSDQVILPRYVAFKGDNGKYLSAIKTEETVYQGRYGSSKRTTSDLQFSADDIADARVLFTTYYNDNGTVRLKSKSCDSFMRFDKNWVKPDGHDDSSDKNTLFKVVKAGDYFGLKSMGNQLFCRRLTLDDKKNCLNAAESNITEEARLLVEEPVLSREIYDVVYHGVEKARVYDMKTITMSTASAINRTSENNNVKLSLTINQVQTSTWDASVALKAGVTTTITAGVPVVAEVVAEISYEFTAAYNWGKTEVKESKHDIVYEVVVPKMKKVTVSAIASQAKADIPFSYTQKDVLPTGEVVVTNNDDGIYTGMNTFNLQYETKEEDLPAPQ